MARFTDNGERHLMQGAARTGANAFTCRLFTAPTTDPDDEVFTGYTEATFTGYGPVTVNFGNAADTGGGVYGCVAAANCVFNHSGTIADPGTSNLIYGWYLTMDNSYVLAGATADIPVYYEYFGAPVTMDLAPDQINILPAITLIGGEDFECA